MECSRFKFRVWDKKNSEYVPEGESGDVHCALYRDGTLECGVAYDDGYAGGIDWVKTEDAIIEQCTGLTDKNGKLIFEGDVLLFNGSRNPVYFDDGSFVILHSGSVFIPIKQKYTDVFEIIGNIHDDQFRDFTKLVEG